MIARFLFSLQLSNYYCTPILKLAIVKRLYVKNLSKKSSNNPSKKFVKKKFIKKICQKKSLKNSSNNWSKNWSRNNSKYYVYIIRNRKKQTETKRNKNIIRIEKQIRSFIFWENLRVNNFVSRSTDLQKLRSSGKVKGRLFTVQYIIYHNP